MKERTLGPLRVSEVGIGCNNFGGRLDQDATTAVVEAALEVGINFFDTADVYGATQSEVLLGRALGSRRSEVIIATKFGMPLDDTRFGAKPAYVKSACEDSLRRLGTDYLDLYQLHYPDDTVPIEETLGALGELVASGQVRAIGCSNLSRAQLRAAHEAAGENPAFVSVQNQYSLLDRSPERDGVLQTCAELSMGFLPFYPLANGLLTGKVKPGEPLPAGTRLAAMPEERSAHWLSDSFREKVTELLALAKEVEIPLLSLAFSWLLDHEPVTSVIAGASTPDQVRANAAAVRVLAPEVRERLDSLADS